MKTQDALLNVLSRRDAPTKYAVAQLLKVQPIMIDHYLNGSRMRQDKAELFQEIFDIEITDVYNPTADAMGRMKANPS